MTLTAAQKHTPGPWELDEEGDTIRADGEFVTRISKSRYHDDRDDPEAQANARLIAAAPELLEALNNAAQVFSNLYSAAKISRNDQGADDPNDWKFHLDYTLAAIAKATGQNKSCKNHPDKPVRENLDGDDLCQECCNAWVKAEGAP